MLLGVSDAVDAAAGRAKLGSSGTFAVLAGTEQRVRLLHEQEVWLDADGPLAAQMPTTVVVRHGHSVAGPVVIVRRDALDALEVRQVTAVWHGLRLDVQEVKGDEVHFVARAGPTWAAEHGARFDYSDGTTGAAPVGELEDVRINQRSLPLSASPAGPDDSTD